MNPVIDLPYALEQVGGDLPFLHELITDICKERATYLCEAQLDNAVRNVHTFGPLIQSFLPAFHARSCSVW